jgi:hypothetical protein
MARLAEVENSFLDSFLPPYGNPRVKTPIWDEGQHMFLTEQYTSAAGHTYYLGVRVSDRFVTILHIGLYYTWTYIDEIDVYAFDGQQRQLIGKTTFDRQFYKEDVVRSATESLIRNYLEGQLKINGSTADHKKIESEVKELVQKSYFSLLNDSNTARRLEAVKPLLQPNN